tara:strand:+ start:110 stop:307 length:198 start_codon:yes stop_codon:yes gene_type:complete
MQKTDDKTIYLEETVPFKDSFLTVSIYESNSYDTKDTLEIQLTFPPKEGEHRICKYLKVKMEESD